MHRRALSLAAVAGMLAVGMGAFGAHALKASATPDQLATWQTAVYYQMTHVLAVLLVLALDKYLSRKALHAMLWLFATGIILFSGSLYAIVLTGVNKLGMITPIGGICFLAGWLVLAVAAGRSTSKRSLEKQSGNQTGI